MKPWTGSLTIFVCLRSFSNYCISLGPQVKYMGWKIALFFVLLSAFNQAGIAQQADNSARLELTGADATAFPEVRVQFRSLPQLASPVMRLSQEQILVREHDLQANIVRLSRLRDGEPLFIALVIDRSAYAAGMPFGEGANAEAGLPALDEVKAAINDLFALIQSGQDSVMLVGYSGEVDLITDLNHELGVFSLIINDLEAGGGAAFFDAVQVAMEALSVHEGMKHVIAFSHGPDTHSRQTSASQVSAYAQAQGIALHVLTTSESERGPYEALAQETHGSYQVVHSPAEMSGYLTALFRSLREEYELVFRSPDPAGDAVVHPFQMDVWQESAIVAEVRAGYRPGEAGLYSAEEEGTQASDLLMWGGILLGLILVAGGLYALILYFRDRAASAPVIPVILELSYDAKRDRLRIRYNVPVRSQPAKFTLYSETGAPLIDSVLSGRKTRALIDISKVPNGHYVCDISNAGVVSETRKMTWHNP